MKIIKKSMLIVLCVTAFSSSVFAQKKKASTTPCMDVLHLFTADNVPAMAPEEEFSFATDRKN